MIPEGMADLMTAVTLDTARPVFRCSVVAVNTALAGVIADSKIPRTVLDFEGDPPEGRSSGFWEGRIGIILATMYAEAQSRTGPTKFQAGRLLLALHGWGRALKKEGVS